MPPYDNEAEKAAIYRLITGDIELALALEPEDFKGREERDMFKACTKAISEHGEADVLIVNKELEDKDWYKKTGGMVFLANFLEISTITPSVQAIIYRLKEQRAIRESTAIYRTIIDKNIHDVPTILTEQSQKIAELLPRSSDMAMDDMIEEILSEDKRISTGFDTCDQLLGGGLAAGNVMVIGARPGTGKTTLACNLMANLIEDCVSFHFFSIEMSRKEVVPKILSALFNETIPNIKSNIRDLLPSIKVPFTINPDIRGFSAIQTEMMMTPHDVIIIDYFQLITTEGGENRSQELEKISNDIKFIAKTIGKPVILLSQLNRNSENDKTNREPILADLRGCGALEQDADIVSFLWDKNAKGEDKETEDVKNALEGKTTKELKWIIRKNRSGATGYIDLLFTPEKSHMQERD